MQLKPGGRVPEKGKKIILRVENVKDLSRDVIKVYHLVHIVSRHHLMICSFYIYMPLYQ